MPPIPVLTQLFGSPALILYSLTLDLGHIALMGNPLTL